MFSEKSERPEIATTAGPTALQGHVSVETVQQKPHVFGSVGVEAVFAPSVASLGKWLIKILNLPRS